LDCHDILDFTEIPSFVAFTIFMFAPVAIFFVASRYVCIRRDATFLWLHDMSESTEMPSFVASQYV
jgi:hypothetical protein